MSSSKKEPGATKQKKSYGGIIGIVKRRSKKKRQSLESSSKSSSTSEAASLNETTTLTEAIEFADPTMEADSDTQVIELSAQLQAAQEELDAAGNQGKQDKETIATLQGELQNLRVELEESRSKLSKVEEITENLDDDSFHQAQEFQLRKKMDELQGELEKRRNLEQEMNRLKEEVQELQVQNQELRFHEERSTTRSKMKNLSEEKTSKEEVQRLQKELRVAERNLAMEKSSLEAQMKAVQDGTDRLKEKIKIIQKRSDDIEKERLELKIENTRLTKKLESSGSYAEKKRIQTEQETAELELKNMKRKTVRLEQQLTASNQKLNLISGGGNGDLGNLSGMTSPPPRQTLSEARIIHLEKDLQQLESTVAKFKKENEALANKASSCEQTSEVFALKVSQLDRQLNNEKNKVEEMETELNKLRKLAAGSSGEDYLAKLLNQVEELEKAEKERVTRFRVKEKDLWSTIEAQKKQIQELEMEKLELELGEDEDGEVALEGDERSITPQPTDGGSELKEEIEKLKIDNEKLKKDLEGAVSKLVSSPGVSGQAQEETERLNSEIYCLKEELGASEAATSKQKEEMRLELVNTETSCANLNAEVSLCQQEIASLKDQNKSLRSKLEKAGENSKQLTSLQNEIQAVKKENEELQKTLSNQATGTASADVITSLEKEVERLNTQTTQLLADLEDAENELDRRDDSAAESGKAQQEIERLKELNEKLKSELNNAEDEVEKMDAELVEQTDILKKKIKELKEENARLSSKTGKKASHL